ncbi:diguanylate cyclase [Desulfobacterales bacterium HSG16]|nr:diguanylate cyclase [Desulfobacterales bacterium HSG16]
MDTVSILIVDDDDAIRFLMNEFVEMVGYKAFMASSGEEALEVLKENVVDVVLTDIMMPGIDGLELTGKIKKIYDVEVIVMTGYSGDYSYENAVDKGASDFVFKPVRFEELLLRIKRVLKERRLRKELQKLAITDGLTKLYNSRHFYHQSEMEIERCKRHKHPLSLLIMDIDFFKSYNDTYGHLAGDKVLSRIGWIIRSCLRKSDSAYRYGGEEFIALLPETGIDDAIPVARRIREAVEHEAFYPEHDEEVHITISIGVTEFGMREKLKSFIKRSDDALFCAKQNGRNRINCIMPQIDIDQSDSE